MFFNTISYSLMNQYTALKYARKVHFKCWFLRIFLDSATNSSLNMLTIFDIFCLIMIFDSKNFLKINAEFNELVFQLYPFSNICRISSFFEEKYFSNWHIIKEN